MDQTVDFSLYNTTFKMPEKKMLLIPVPVYVKSDEVSQYLDKLVNDLGWEVISFKYSGFKMITRNGQSKLVMD